MKTTCYILFYIFILKDSYLILEQLTFKDTTLHLVLFVLMSLLNIAVKKTPVCQNWHNGENEKPMKTATNIINSVLMFIGLLLIPNADIAILHIITILIVLALFMQNSANLLKRNIAFGIYVGIKFTLLMIVILGSFHSPNYIISICSFLFAIGSIICGFQFGYKSLRIYGLVLSLLSIAKLIILDITYTNTLGHAFSFFICGILCFVINMIYNYVDKKLKDTAE